MDRFSNIGNLEGVGVGEFKVSMVKIIKWQTVKNREQLEWQSRRDITKRSMLKT